jgi:hypothetical protein
MEHFLRVTSWQSFNFYLTQVSKALHWPRVKAIVTILFSLALVLSHLPAFASPAKQLCESATACACGDSTCCMKSPDSAPAPLAPAPAPDNSRTQLLAAFQTVAHFVLIQPESVATPHFLPAPHAAAAVPLYVRNCSYLI